MSTDTVKCGECGGVAYIGKVCTTCSKCGASVDPKTGKAFMYKGEVVKSICFGGDVQ